MRVLQVDSGREWRGGQNQVRLLCRELVRTGDVHTWLVSRRGSELARRAAADGVLVHETAWSLGLDPRAWWSLVDAVTDFRPDIIHTHDSHSLRLALWARGLLALARVRDVLVVASRRVDFPVRWRSSWSQADRIVAISAAVKQVLVESGLSARDIAVVPDGIDPDEVRRAAATPLGIRARLGLADGTPLAVNVAALVDHKDQRTLIRAAAAARGRRPDLHWAIAGEGDRRRSLEAEIAARGVADRVHLLGYVAEADALIAEAQVFVMSSKEEGLGSVILHALALEKPVVATAGGGIPEILPPEALVPVGDSEALAHKVVAALSHSATRGSLPERCTAPAMAAGVLAVYRSLL